MGRALRVTGPASGRSGERSKEIGQVRAKRKKRKRDLEELHRNVLEAKRNARHGATQHKLKWKTNFTKVLNKFADKRRDNEQANEVFGDGVSRRKTTKRICDRLLPEPMVGMYQNGAKGREIRRAVGLLNETNVARLQGNVLKLLKGDETNPKSSWEREENEKMNKRANHDRPSDDFDESDSESEASICQRNRDALVHGKTKVDKRINREKTRLASAPGETKNDDKDRLTELPRQRDEDKCKRRLFEPDEMNENDRNSFGIIDRRMITDHEIRFSPSKTKKKFANDCAKISCVEGKEISCELAGKSERNDYVNSSASIGLNNGRTIDGNFWGWSPAICYERLCAMICIDNFEDKPHFRRTGTEPDVKIRKILRGFFLRNRENSQKSSRKSPKSKARLPCKTIITSNGRDEIYQACTQDSHMEQCSSSGSSTAMIGSWHLQRNFQLSCSNDDASVVEDDKTEKIVRTIFRDTLKCQRSGINDESRLNEVNKNDVSSSDTVEKTISSVSVFLKKFNDNNPLNRKEKDIFEMDVDGANADDEKSSLHPETPPGDSKLIDNPLFAPRRNIKHVPTILRRSNGHWGAAEAMEQEDNPRGLSSSSPERRDPKRHNRDNGNSIFPAARNDPIVPRNKKIHSTDPTCSSSLIFQDANYHRHRTPIRETSKKLIDQQQLDRALARKSKLNFVISKCTTYSRLSSSEELEVQQPSQDNDYEESLSDRNIETTSREFVRAVNVDNVTAVDRSLRQEPRRVMDFRSDLTRQSESEERKNNFFNDTNRIFDANERDNCGCLDPGFRCRKNDHEAGINARKTQADLSRDARKADPRDFKRFSSSEFLPVDQIDRATNRADDPKAIARNKHTLRDPRESMSLLARGRSRNESSVVAVNEDLTNKPIAHRHTRNIPVFESSEGCRCIAAEESRISGQSIENRRSVRCLVNSQRIHENPCLTGRSACGPVVSEQHRGIIKKAVVLFRPIDDTREKKLLQPQNCISREPSNSESTAMREAVRNLRVLAFEDNAGEQVTSGIMNRDDCRESRQRVSMSRGDCRWNENLPSQPDVRRFESYSQPAKFLAYERTDGMNPQRVPIYEKSDFNGVPRGDNSGKIDSSRLLRIIETGPERTGALYLRPVGMAESRNEQNLDAQLVQQRGNGILSGRQNYRCNNDSTVHRYSATDDCSMERQRSHRVALMAPLPTVNYHRASNVPPSSRTPATRLESTRTDIPAGRIVRSVADHERLTRAAQLRYELESLVREPVATMMTRDQSRYGEFREADLPERIQLPDGRIGILLAENSSDANSSQRFDVNPSRNSILRINGPNSNVETGQRIYELAGHDGIFHYQSEYRWNTDYDSNEAYRRSTRTNAVADSLSGQ